MPFHIKQTYYIICNVVTSFGDFALIEQGIMLIFLLKQEMSLLDLCVHLSGNLVNYWYYIVH
jgi:hypothetical protein